MTQNQDHEPLQLATEREDVVLRELSTPADDEAYFAAVAADPKHLGQFGDTTGAKYQTVEDVERARLNAGSKIRMGIWAGNIFVGSVNATPDEEGGAEIGYWLDIRHTGHGYATLAAKALSQYAAQRFSRVYADVVEGNEDSAGVLDRAGFHRVPSREIGHMAFELASHS